MTVLGVRLRDLGSDLLTWSDLATMIAHPARGGALHESIHGDNAVWGFDTQLTAIIADRLGHIIWQLGGDDNTDPPMPIHPAARARRVDSDEPVDDEDALTMEELGAMLGIGE